MVSGVGVMHGLPVLQWFCGVLPVLVKWLFGGGRFRWRPAIRMIMRFSHICVGFPAAPPVQPGMSTTYRVFC